MVWAKILWIMSNSPRLRCAIYTRKSSEEGLDQDFNSLDAQREACEAYVKSQASLGWKVSPTLYDDGGISGGTMASKYVHTSLPSGSSPGSSRGRAPVATMICLAL